MKEKPSIEFEFKELPLRYEWKLSRNTSVSKTNGVLCVKSGHIEGFGEVAPNIRYGETPESIRTEFTDCRNDLLKAFTEGIDVRACIAALPVSQALKTGLDMAVCDLLSKTAKKSIAALYGLPEPGPRKICYTIPVMEATAIPSFIERENLHRFEWLKIKVNAETALSMTETVLKNYAGSIAIDGNEAWKETSAALGFIRDLPQERIMFIEQPFPAAMRESYPWLKERSPLEIWGDESVLGKSEPEYWKVAFSGINVKLMKTGSIGNAVRMLMAARAEGLKTMIGCMVETSIGIAAAIQLESLADFMDLDGFLLLENEPFGRVSEDAGVVYLSPTV